MARSARFDDLSGAGRAFRLVDPVDEIVATRPAEVRPALRQIEAATRAGRWAGGFVTYEAAAGLDPALSVHPAGDLPLVSFGVFAGREPVAPIPPPSSASATPRWRPRRDQAWHRAAIGRVHDAIAAGDTYQVNLGLHLESFGAIDPMALYRQLGHAQRSAYGTLIEAGPVTVVSASPELFFEFDGTTLTTRPMKGTAWRGRWAAEDDERRDALGASAKDRAENLMIVDLLRNDLGRVARFGSVRVEQLFALERYETVWQMTSTVSAAVADPTSLEDVFAALFPCGSVTGAPKVRTMQLIAELEGARRGVFCGAVGVVGPPLRARFAVGIRTAVLTAAGATYGVGSGVTWSSDSAGEWEELMAKTRVLTDVRPSFQLLETMRYDPAGGLRHADAHLERLAASARYFGFNFDEAPVERALSSAVAGLGRAARVRLLLSRDGQAAADVGPLPPADARPVRLRFDPVPVDSSDVFAFHKTTNRDRLRRPSTDVLLFNERGELTESPIANVAVRLGGRWWTPPVASGCLPGVERQRLLADGTLAERVLTAADVTAAEELALVSSLRGWRPAEVDQRSKVEAWSGTYV